MVHSLIVFAETTVTLIAFCILGVSVQADGASVGPDGIYLSLSDPYSWGVTLGSFGVGAPRLEQHERGHMIQHDKLGLAYWAFVAIPSLISAATSTNAEHHARWYERQATLLGSQ